MMSEDELLTTIRRHLRSAEKHPETLPQSLRGIQLAVERYYGTLPEQVAMTAAPEDSARSITSPSTVIVHRTAPLLWPRCAEI